MVCLALAGAGCGPRPGARAPGGSSDSAQLAEAVARLRLERRQRERKIRDLENQLAARGEAPSPAMSTSSSSISAAGEGDVPSLPVQVLTPARQARGAAADDQAAPTVLGSTGLGRGSEAELPGEVTVDGERVIGLSDDGSEIVYVDDAAAGRVVAPSPEVLAEMSRTQRRSASPTRLDGPELDEGNARELIDDAAAERLPPAPAPLASLGRRAARARPQPARPAAASSASSPAAASSNAAAGKLRLTRPAGPPEPTVRGGEAEAHYQRAIAMVRGAEYPEAIASLRDFLQRYPRHDYADNAQYWLGEAFYAQRQYDKALVELRRVVEVYPQGNKVPDALLKVGYCHLAMGERDKSSAVLRELIRLFPRSGPAHLAQKKLEEVIP